MAWALNSLFDPGSVPGVLVVCERDDSDFEVVSERPELSAAEVFGSLDHLHDGVVLAGLHHPEAVGRTGVDNL